MAERRRILVVEDDEVVREMLVEALRLEDYEVRTAAHGGEALAVLEGWRADAIVLDLMMPVLDGWGFREEQRKRPAVREIPVLVLSASRELGRARETLAPAGTLAKPFELDALLGAVATVLDGAATRR